jgi:hypothetical protein
MIIGVQVVGILVLLFLLYLTFIYYKKGTYTRNEFLFWCGAWISASALLVFPDVFINIGYELKFARATDFYMALAIIFFGVITFLNYARVRNQERKVGELVRAMALKRK